MGGGTQSSESSSRPLTAAERTNIFAGGIAPLTGIQPEFDVGGNVTNQVNIMRTALDRLNSFRYDAPKYSDAAPLQRLGNGDYDALEQAMVTSRTAPLKREMELSRQGVDDNAAKRGVWSSGLAIRAQNDVDERYAPQLRAAGADASAAR